MFVVDAYHGGDSGLVVLIVLWKIHLWTIIHSEWGGIVKMVCVYGKDSSWVWWLSLSICCVMIIERLDEFFCAAIRAQCMVSIVYWWSSGCAYLAPPHLCENAGPIEPNRLSLGCGE